MTAHFVHCTPEAERLIVRMARVSNPDNADNWETGPQLLRYLITHRHWSPFEMASLCLRFETERDIAAQILRHRSLSFQEYSTRYARTLPAEIPAQRRQDTNNRQNSFDDLPPDEQIHWDQRLAQQLGNAHLLYEDMLQAGLAKETARRVLPLCTPTTLYVHGTLRSWIHYFDVRTDPSTQLEHRELAEAARAIFTAKFPVIAEAAWPTP
ncbi:MAG: FAD-dependent thymidylate synthase [Steroidobacteraceae bacterium]